MSTATSPVDPIHPQIIPQILRIRIPWPLRSHLEPPEQERAGCAIEVADLPEKE